MTPLHPSQNSSYFVKVHPIAYGGAISIGLMSDGYIVGTYEVSIGPVRRGHFPVGPYIGWKERRGVRVSKKEGLFALDEVLFAWYNEGKASGGGGAPRESGVSLLPS
jgi:hypothetical protein